MSFGGILQNKRVIDLTQNVAGPFCTQILGDLGAEVIKVERPGAGDDTRNWRPPEIGGQSATFFALNRNKRSIGVDLDREEGRDVVRSLVRDADIVIHSLKPGSAERRGLGYDDLKALNPKLIYCAISAFGRTGPLAALPGYDPLLQAFTGVMSVTGIEGQEPVRVGVSLIDMGTGMWAAMGILGALLRQTETGQGALVEASLLETGMSWMTVPAASYLATGTLPKRMGSAMAMTSPYELFRARDGHVFIGAGNDRLFRSVCEGLGCSEIADDPRFRSNPDRVTNRGALHEAIETATCDLPAADIVARLRRTGAPCTEMKSIADALSDEQVGATGIVLALPLDGQEDSKVIGLPFQIDGSRGILPSSPPKLGADTSAILESMGMPANALAALRDGGVID